MSDIQELINQVQKEAQKEEFPIDIPVYKSAKLEPTYPVLYAGNLQSPLCFFGRDLGKDEVHARQPLIGAAGTKVRQGFYQLIHGKTTNSIEELKTICDRVLLTNTVPYKPPGNKAYSVKVKERFRPYVERLLVFHWQGNQIITLGTEAFKWYARYREKGELDRYFKRSDRYEEKLVVEITATDDRGNSKQKSIILLPLPHPSPLNKKYYAIFPKMLQQRLAQIEF
ncbi:Uracil-DNA glycosylase [Hyella patelloides LEGE 07179]|uniref:Uracil-DNA glycosylase n=1 Tax=Hyella patelloides LEGE 07179 TaxID=945734 RepID=A0A563VLJ7_9CYAN|nr:uracil-DNA glycosylase family protein [Hyella patelloides]VEP12326.1 Uracil-DNA glycosylase [Hyella patelloides LEGE 07179]